MAIEAKNRTIISKADSSSAHQVNDKVITLSTLTELEDALANIHQNAVIFLDVDDTLITPQSKLFRAQSPFRTLIDQIKNQRDQIANFEEIVSHWRLQRKTMLVSKEWPRLIETLKKTHPVYALTKLDTGRVGDIPSMEKWRYEELKDHGITFTPTCPGISEGILLEDSSKSRPATFTKGIFMTGSFTKGDVIAAFLKAQQPSQVILIDDRPEYLQDAVEECSRHSLHFLGILFKGVELIPGIPEPKVAEYQQQQLLEHSRWVEDEQAAKEIDYNS